MTIFRIQYCQLSCLKINRSYFTLWYYTKADVLFRIICLSNHHSHGWSPAYNLLAGYYILNVHKRAMAFKLWGVRNYRLIPLDKGKHMFSVYIHPAINQFMNIRSLQKINCLF